MAEIQIDQNDLRCYAITPAPPKWELQEYINAYSKENDDKYIVWFLHYYENTLNGNVRKITQRYSMPEAFADIKQAYVIGLLKALKKYDVCSIIHCVEKVINVRYNTYIENSSSVY